MPNYTLKENMSEYNGSNSTTTIYVSKHSSGSQSSDRIVVKGKWDITNLSANNVEVNLYQSKNFYINNIGSIPNEYTNGTMTGTHASKFKFSGDGSAVFTMWSTHSGSELGGGSSPVYMGQLLVTIGVTGGISKTKFYSVYVRP